MEIRTHAEELERELKIACKNLTERRLDIPCHGGSAIRQNGIA
jgi:hypothetical protein